MPLAVAMPKLGMTMREGTVLEYRVRPGDRVAKGQIILRIESEKTEVEIEAPASGVIRHLYVEPDALVPCGTFLAAITESGDEAFDPDAFRSQNERAETRPAAGARTSGAAAPAPSAGVSSGALPRPAERPVVPAARKRARDLCIDLERVAGSGPNGRVTVEDVEAFAAQIGERVLVAPGIQLEVPSQGAGETVLLLPGFGSDVSAFGPQIPWLAQTHLVRGVNPRGVGFSSAAAAERDDVTTAASDAAALLDAPAHLIGASLGAAVALELALSQPEQVRSLVLITPFVTATPRLLAVVDAWARVAAESSPEALAAMLLPWLYGGDFLSDTAACRRAAKSLAEAAARIPAATLKRQAAGLRAWSGTREGDLGRLRARTLVIAGADDLLTPGAAELARKIPGASLELVPGAGHAVGIEAAERVSRAILAHLRAG